MRGLYAAPPHDPHRHPNLRDLRLQARHQEAVLRPHPQDQVPRSSLPGTARRKGRHSQRRRFGPFLPQGSSG